MDFVGAGAPLASKVVTGAPLFEAYSLAVGLAEFADAAVGAVEQSTVHHDPGAEPGAQGDSHQVAASLAGAEDEFAEGEGVGVVVDDRRDAEPLLEFRLERNRLPRGDVADLADDAFNHIDDAGDSAADRDNLGGHHIGDGVHHHSENGVLVLVSRDAALDQLQEFALVNPTSGNLGAAEIDADDGLVVPFMP